ncbi:3-oxoacyl-[acyl-carrier-protein] reductase [Candidatus Marinimicrobia bacterium]|nr:3-oxoacyl-[acyl-carrier-protein] reductase [Candidatus Neomarinimicrobiota bacterium]
MNLKLNNKVAIVTGASRGIGFSIANMLAEEGVKVALISRNIESLIKAREQMSHSENIIFFSGDIVDSNFVKITIEKVFKKWNKIDIMVNNAGINKDKILLRMKEQDWDNVINTNLKGCYNTMKSVSKYMLRQKSGKIINISSVIGQIGNSGQSNYAASKSGIEGLTRSLAVELGSRNININCIAPGYIETDMTNKLDTQILNNMKKNIPLNKLGACNDIANLVCYLASDLSSYITGQVINVDGGMTIN